MREINKRKYLHGRFCTFNILMQGSKKVFFFYFYPPLQLKSFSFLSRWKESNVSLLKNLKMKRRRIIIESTLRKFCIVKILMQGKKKLFFRQFVLSSRVWGFYLRDGRKKTPAVPKKLEFEKVDEKKKAFAKSISWCIDQIKNLFNEFFHKCVKPSI